jgi:hypothetical protein
MAVNGRYDTQKKSPVTVKQKCEITDAGCVIGSRGVDWSRSASHVRWSQKRTLSTITEIFEMIKVSNHDGQKPRLRGMIDGESVQRVAREEDIWR